MKTPQAGQHETAIGTHGKNHKQSETNRTRRNNLHDKIRYKVGITKRDPTQKQPIAPKKIKLKTWTSNKH